MGARVETPAPPQEGVSVVFPVYRNAEMLPELVRRTLQACSGRPCQIVMVNDASPDGSAAVMAQLPVDAIHLPENRGQNGAILAGLQASRYPVSVVMDADLQDPPESIPILLGRLAAGDVDVVFSSRSTRTRVSSWLFRWAMHLLFPSLPRSACLHFAITGEARNALIAVARPDDYLLAPMGALRMRAATVAVSKSDRPSGRSSYAGSKRVRHAARLLRLSLRTRLAAAAIRRAQPAWRARKVR